jgi:hypothetical protein
MGLPVLSLLLGRGVVMGVVIPSRRTAATAAAWIASKQLKVIGDYLHLGTVLSVLLPAILSQLPVNADEFSLNQVLMQGLALPSPDHDIKEIRLVLPLIAVLSAAVHGNGKFTNRLAIRD